MKLKSENWPCSPLENSPLRWLHPRGRLWVRVVAKCLIKDPPYLQMFEIKNLHDVYIIELGNETSEGRARFLCFISCYLKSVELCTVFSELQMTEILIFYPFAYLTLLVIFCINTNLNMILVSSCQIHLSQLSCFTFNCIILPSSS